MNNTFDFNRFSLLVKRQWVENKKLFLMASFALLGLGMIGYPLSINWDNGDISDAIQALLFLGGLFIAGTFFTNYIFKDFSDKNSTTHFLMTPSSHLEKLLSGIFYSFIVFPVVFLTIFFVIDYFYISYANSFHQNLVAENLIQDSSWKDNTLWFEQLSEKPKIFLQPLIGMWFIAQSATIIGTIFFSRWAYIKTAFTGFILFFSIYLIAGFAFETLVTDLAHKVEINSNAYTQIKPTHDMLNNIIFMALKYVFTPILLLIAYFKLKEKQV